MRGTSYKAAGSFYNRRAFLIKGVVITISSRKAQTVRCP
jgi:hypothetical protein